VAALTKETEGKAEELSEALEAEAEKGTGPSSETEALAEVYLIAGDSLEFECAVRGELETESESCRKESNWPADQSIDGL